MANEIKIGLRIRELRQQKGMTQKELAGDRITRNMLSLIESGSSCPSVATLLYLAERLQVPVGYFFITTPEEESIYRKSAVIRVLKSAFAENRYKECSELCDAIPVSYADDEISMIGATSALRAAMAYAEKYEIRLASVQLTKAAEFASRTLYLDSTFLGTLEYYTVLFRTLNSTEIPAPLTDLSYASAYIPYEMILYFRIAKNARGIKNVSSPFISGTLYEKHIEAILLMNDEKWDDALKLLKELSADPALPYFMQYPVHCDLEAASNQTGDVRGAYVAARKKIELLEAVN